MLDLTIVWKKTFKTVITITIHIMIQWEINSNNNTHSNTMRNLNKVSFRLWMLSVPRTVIIMLLPFSEFYFENCEWWSTWYRTSVDMLVV